MTAITYTARLSVTSGHTAGESYTLTVPMAAINRSADMDRSRHVALDGTTETLWNRLDQRWRLTTSYLDEAGLAQMREFLDSALTGEPFQLDVYGTGAFVSALLEGDSYSEQRIGTGHVYQISFEVRTL